MKNNLTNFYERIFENYPDVVDVKTMCKMLGNISMKTGYKIIKEKKVKAFKIGRAFYVTKFHILEYLQIKDDK